MTTIQIELQDPNRQKLDALALRTGRTRDELVNEAVERLVLDTDEEEHEKFLAWREALLGIEGMWADRLVTLNRRHYPMLPDILVPYDKS